MFYVYRKRMLSQTTTYAHGTYVITKQTQILLYTETTSYAYCRLLAVLKSTTQSTA